MAQSVTIKVEGLVELQRALRAADKDLPKQLRKVNLAAAEVVADEARRHAPVVTGKLKSSIKAQAQQREASVKWGSPARVPYGAAAHWGYKNRPQGGSNPRNPFVWDARTMKMPELRELYADELRAFVNDVL